MILQTPLTSEEKLFAFTAFGIVFSILLLITGIREKNRLRKIKIARGKLKIVHVIITCISFFPLSTKSQDATTTLPQKPIIHWIGYPRLSKDTLFVSYDYNDYGIYQGQKVKIYFETSTKDSTFKICYGKTIYPPLTSFTFDTMPKTMSATLIKPWFTGTKNLYVRTYVTNEEDSVLFTSEVVHLLLE